MFLAPLLLAGAAAAAGPDALLLVRRATESPEVPYYGRMTEVQWYGKRARAAVVQIFFKPPDMMRREIHARGGTPTQLTVSDGSEEWIVLPDRKKAWKGQAAKTKDKRITEEEEWALVSRNYDVRIEGEEEVAGRDCWVAELKPKEPGKPRQSLTVDKATGLILRARKFHADGSLASMFHFTHVRVPAEIPDSYFDYEPPAGFQVEEHKLAPDFLTLDQVRDSVAAVPKTPPVLGSGFQFESAGLVKVGKLTVAHLRYTDGLVTVSFFESPAAVGLQELTGSKKGEGAVPGGAVLQWKTKGKHFIVIGDVSRALLGRLAAEFKKGT